VWYRLVSSIPLFFLANALSGQTSVVWKDPSPHTTQFVSVEKNVRLEVLEWGGPGKAIILLAGGGDTAHVFDDFAPKLSGTYHVYGITRRGFGASGYSPTDSPADRLGDDVVAVIDALRIKKPTLVGHSIAGAELSSVANRYPDRVSGLIYLDAAYSYAFDNGQGTSVMEMQKLQGPDPPPPGEADLASFRALQKYLERVNGFPFPEAELREQRELSPDGRVGKERNPPGSALFLPLLTSIKKFTAVPVRALILFANPHSQGAWVDKNTNPAVQAAARAYSTALSALTLKQEKAVERGVPTARVITLPNAHHYIFLSNEADVLRDMQAFLAGPR
jgi:pimeloyl-ACP methyl ester carboxylesterase